MIYRIIIYFFFSFIFFTVQAQDFSDAVSYDTTYVDKKELPEIDYTPPQYKGGTKGIQAYINEKLYNSPLTESDSITQHVYLKVSLDEKGSITNVVFLRGINDEINAIVKEAILDMPAWNPATSSGEPISSDRAISLKIQPSLLSAER